MAGHPAGPLPPHRAPSASSALLGELPIDARVTRVSRHRRQSDQRGSGRPRRATSRNRGQLHPNRREARTWNSSARCWTGPTSTPPTQARPFPGRSRKSGNNRQDGTRAPAGRARHPLRRPRCRLGYLYRHAPANATLFEQVLLGSGELGQGLRDADRRILHVCAIDGGPGTEFLGLAKFLIRRSGSVPRKIAFTHPARSRRGAGCAPRASAQPQLPPDGSPPVAFLPMRALAGAETGGGQPPEGGRRPRDPKRPMSLRCDDPCHRAQGVAWAETSLRVSRALLCPLPLPRRP